MKNFEKKYSDIPVYTIVINPLPPKELFPLPKPKEEIVIHKEVAKSALKLENVRKITLSGDLNGAVLFDGSEDVTLKATVKVADRAYKDSKGNDISKTYAKKSELEDYVLKSEIYKKLNYLEKIIYATKETLNETIGENFASEDDITNLFGDDTEISPSGADSDTSSGNLATEDDINALFGDD